MSVTTNGNHAQTRIAGAVAIVSGLAALALLAAHPAESAQTFAGMVAEEAANLEQNAVAHGGFIAVLALQLAAFGVLSERLGATFAARAAFTFFAIGAAWLSLSMLLDGLVAPALAARYAAHPDKIDSLRPVFAFLGLTVQRVMPLGLGFQAAAILSWSAALFANRRIVFGASALVLGGALAVAVYSGAFAGLMIAMIGGFVLLAAWAVLAGVVLLRS